MTATPAPNPPERNPAGNWRLPPMPLNRRVLLGSALTVGAATTAGFMLSNGGAVPASGGEKSRKLTHMQIVAHPDDDLYFYNPDLWHSIKSGYQSVSVCITCGEGDGRNGGDSQPEDFESYVTARYNGLRAAHADMAVGDPAAKWKRTRLKLSAGPVAELCTLEDEPRIHMIFLNLWSNAKKRENVSGDRLTQLWSDEIGEHDTMIPNGSPVERTYTYSRSKLLDVLQELLTSYDPIVVRTMDPDPDPQVHNEAHPRYADQYGYSDHEDHTPAGLFAWEALSQWWHAGHGKNTIVESYRGYYGRRWPRNLSKSARKAKGRSLDVYAWRDQRDCGDPNGCGDLKITSKGVGPAYGASTIYRYTSDTHWLQKNGEGKLFATLVRGGRAVRWVESSSGTEQGSYTEFGPDSLLPSLVTYGAGADVWHSFAIAADFRADPKNQTRDLMVRSYSFSNAVGTWTNLGNPDADAGISRRSIGIPVATQDSRGMVVVAARDHDRHIAVRVQKPAGGFGDWTKLDGPTIQDGLSAVADGNGNAHVFGSAKDGVAWWYQSDSQWHSETISTVAPAGPPTVVKLADNRLMLLVRREDTAKLYCYFQTETGGGFDTDSHKLGGSGGIGPICALAPPQWDGRVAIATRNDDGKVSCMLLDTASGNAEHDWSDGGPTVMHAPASAVDETGRWTVAALGQDASLYLARQVEPGIGVPVEWRKVAS